MHDRGLESSTALVAAACTRQRTAVTVRSVLWYCDSYGDQSFLRADWATGAAGDPRQPHLGPTQVNQRRPHSPALHRWLHRQRERIDSIFHEMQHTGRNLERLLGKPSSG